MRSEALTNSVYSVWEHRERTAGRMNEHDKARPVSGEIMTGGQTRRETVQPVDFSDAEYETVGTQREARPARFSPAGPATGMDFLKAGPAAETVTEPNRRGGPLFWATGLTLVILAFWVSGGHALVRHVAIPSPAETIQPLRIGEIRSRVENRNGRDVLFVDGQAENHSAQPRTLPPIEIAVTANDDQTTRYFLGTNEAELKPGGRYSFSSRLEVPRYGVKSVSVTFQEVIR